MMGFDDNLFSKEKKIVKKILLIEKPLTFQALVFFFKLISSFGASSIVLVSTIGAIP